MIIQVTYNAIIGMWDWLVYDGDRMVDDGGRGGLVGVMRAADEAAKYWGARIVFLGPLPDPDARDRL